MTEVDGGADLVTDKSTDLRAILPGFQVWLPIYAMIFGLPWGLAPLTLYFFFCKVG